MANARLFSKKNTSSILFIDKLKEMIRASSRLQYPESKSSLEPDFTQPIAVETSWIRRFNRRRNATKVLMRRFDVAGLEFTYENLADEYSREMFLQVLVRNLFYRTALRFPLYYSKYIKQMTDIALLREGEQELQAAEFMLQQYNLMSMGWDVRVWSNSRGILTDFVNEQYRYQNKVIVKEGDFVIDGGACWGETSMYFAARAKSQGKVFAFEFVPANLDIFAKNLALNPQYHNTVELMESGLSDGAEKTCFFVENGPGSRLTNQEEEGSAKIPLVSIDDLVEKRGLEKLDFIKLDVEKVLIISSH